MFAKLIATLSAAFLLVAGATGVASARSDTWTGVHTKMIKPATSHWTHVKPSSDTWDKVKPSSDTWTHVKPLSDTWT